MREAAAQVERAEWDGESSAQYDTQIEEYNQRFLNESRPVAQQAQEDWVLFWRIMNDHWTLRKLLTILTIVLGLLYLIAPYDIIPDYFGMYPCSKPSCRTLHLSR